MFDLNQALCAWRKQLDKFESFEAGTKMELESHLLEEFDVQKRNGLAEEEAFARAAAAVGRPEDVGGEYFKESRRSRHARPPWEKSRFSPGLLFNYLKVALRNFRRHIGYSLINIMGLAMGMALLLVIVLYVRHELSFDRFIEHSERIFRLETDHVAVLPPAVKNAVLGNIPGVQHCLRLNFLEKRLLGRNENCFNLRHFVYADDSLLDVFSLTLSAGDARTALQAPFSIILTRKLAQKLFGLENPIGKTVRYQNKYDMQVSGVFQEIPNFHIEVEAVASFATLEKFDKKHLDEEFNDDWAYPTYVMLQPNQQPAKVAEAINRYFRQKKIWSYPIVFRLRPLKRIYFSGGSVPSAKGRYGNMTLVVAFGIIGFFILLLAAVNFINLSTARSALRAREVGIRKASGAQRWNLMLQFLAESFLTAVFSAILALLLVAALLPYLNSLIQVRLVLKSFFTAKNILWLLLGVLAVGITAGIYPAMILSSFDPITAVKGQLARRCPSAIFRRGLLVFQFIVSLVLMIGTFTVLRQLHYMKTKDTGFIQKHIIYSELNPELFARKPILKTRLMAIPQVAAVSFSCRVPGQEWWSWSAYENKQGSCNVNSVDPDYFDLMGIKLLKGRNFSWAQKSDLWKSGPGARQSYIMNERAASLFGLSEPASVIGGQSRFKNDSLIGIVKDFHFYSPHTPIEPLIFYWNESPQWTVSIKFTNQNIHSTLQKISAIFRELAPTFPFEYQFLDESYGKQFEREERLGKILSVFSLLAFVIAALGLFGLTAFLVLQRRREIGIRKVLGASFKQINGMLAAEYLKWVALANLIAWPIAYSFMSRWLQNFAYRTVQNIGTFFLSGALSMLAALLTVSVQTIRAARANPVDSLRYE